MNKRQQFDVSKAIPAAWDKLWKERLARRASDWKGETYYLTCADVEEQVRVFAQEQLDGKAWGSSGQSMRYYGGGPRISTGDRWHTLESLCRDWLLRNMAYHNFSRGHISGARYRPHGEPLSPQEINTMAKHAKEDADRKAGKERVRHMRDGDRWGHALCVEERRRKTGNYYRCSHRSQVWTTDEREEVTCKQCLNLLKAKEPEQAALRG
jgi:hypothetical protein